MIGKGPGPVTAESLCLPLPHAKIELHGTRGTANEPQWQLMIALGAFLHLELRNALMGLI